MHAHRRCGKEGEIEGGIKEGEEVEKLGREEKVHRGGIHDVVVPDETAAIGISRDKQ